MKTIIVFMSSAVLGWLGWWLGYHFNFTMAFFLSVVGTSLGVYIGRRFVNIY